jgi:hypothetical protein
VSCRKNLKVERASKESKRENKTISKIVQVEYTKVEHGSTFPEILMPGQDIKGLAIGNTDEIFLSIKGKLAECGYAYPGIVNSFDYLNSLLNDGF